MTVSSTPELPPIPVPATETAGAKGADEAQDVAETAEVFNPEQSGNQIGAMKNQLHGLASNPDQIAVTSNTFPGLELLEDFA